MPRLPIPSDTEGFPEETRAVGRHILKTRNGMPPPSSYLTYAGQAGGLLLRPRRPPALPHVADPCGDGAGDLHLGASSMPTISGAGTSGWACRLARARRRSTPSTRTGRWTA